MRTISTLGALGLIAAASIAAAPLPVHIGGRVIAEADGSATFGWPGVYFESRFRGTAVRVRFEAPAEYLRLLIDGQEKRTFRRAGSVDVVIDGLTPGEHVVRLEKQTESQSGGGRFIGFFAAADGIALPAPADRARRIEFIGDSYTVGYGNLSTSRTCSQAEVHDTTDTQQAFGPLVARRFDADYRINAFSGFGMVRNYNGGSPGQSLPFLYPRLKPDDAAHLEAVPSGWKPDVVVVNLGTNDFSTPVHAGEPWRDEAALQAAYRDRYVAFVQELRTRQPQARVILMGSDLFYDQVEKVAATLNAADTPPVTTVKFTGLAYSGCHAHPSTADDRLLAGLVGTEIRRVEPGWTD